jgi:hypothetical protein
MVIVPAVSTSKARGGRGAGGRTVTRKRAPSCVTSIAPESTRSSTPIGPAKCQARPAPNDTPPEASSRNSPTCSTLTPGKGGTGGGEYWKLWL